MGISTLAAAYLFFGGAGAGAFFCSVVAEYWWSRCSLAGGGSNFVSNGLQRSSSVLSQNTSGRGSLDLASALTALYALSAGFLALGMASLIFDLGRPEEALLVFLSPTLSYISVGAYCLTILLLCICVQALIVNFAPVKPLFKTLRQVVCVLGAVLAVAVMLYTGLLLRSLAPVHLWVSWWMPVLFLISSLASGLGLFVLCLRFVDRRPQAGRAVSKKLAAVDLVLLALEALACGLLLLDAYSTPQGAAGVQALLTGEASVLFVGCFVLCGVVVPSFIDILALRRRASAAMVTAGAALGVCGCFGLRLALVLAGSFGGL